jgi:hypothetical protein
LFPGNPSKFLELLSFGTFAITFVGFFFLRVYPHTDYHSVPGRDGDLSESQQLYRTSSQESKTKHSYNAETVEPGTSASTNTDHRPNRLDQGSTRTHSPRNSVVDVEAPEALERGDDEPEVVDETSSLMSRSRSSSSSSLPGEILVQSSVDLDRSHRVDIRGLKLLANKEFWQLFVIMGILSGIGLMTIK